MGDKAGDSEKASAKDNKSWNPFSGSRSGPTPAAGPSSSAAAAPHPNEEPLPAYDASEAAGVPTVNAPFQFPADEELPAYSATNFAGGSTSSSQPLHQQPPIAIPQEKPDAASPFLIAYAPTLLNYGITEQTWRSFLETVSAFLAAKVSDRAVSHAADIARDIGEGPKSLGKSIASHTKSVGKNIASQAKRGNVIGAAFGVIGGAISIPVHSALATVGTAVSLPSHAIGAVVKKPQTPYQRAVAYVAVANKKWFTGRGLHAVLAHSPELEHLLALPTGTLVQKAQAEEAPSAAIQLKALEEHIAAVLVPEKAPLELSTGTLWLVLFPVSPEVREGSGVKN
ncbi:unnamed protein product [Clonostachys chloroleuca]|uniref:Uncharacterized protein n=1 Tax=Clonostachys chloroleuca TaxID=1926264 RepID=A0AA35VCC2_9HYPO|nr:unnamed protein product [Clonostachys chloroleuca]